MEVQEIWKDVPDYEGYYQVSNLGRVKGLERTVNNSKNSKRIIKERFLKQYFSTVGYLVVVIQNDKIKNKSFSVHQLVAMAFLNHIPCGYKLVVDHINNIKTDNRLENLQIITNRENSSKDKKNYSSKFVGVYWNKRNGKWRVAIRINGKPKHLGYFTDEIEASNAYKNELKKITIK